MARDILTVLAGARSGRRDEFRHWYDNVHIPELQRKFSEIERVERFDVRGDNTGTDSSVDSIAIYVINGSAGQLWERMCADATLTRSPVFDYRNVVAYYSE